MRRILAAALAVVLAAPAAARDLDGRYARENPALHQWFDQLASGKGLCCSSADGAMVEDADWDVVREGRECRKYGDGDYEGSAYCVRLLGQWWVVPKAAVITEPNIAHVAVVWPVYSTVGTDAETKVLENIRCFLPGAGA